ncbi:hypothetical protein HUN59_04605 [Curtobacterium sp. Csp2]|uniref:hypothetical protein n=1 Tax=Curtobacterium sp. Csp2 TaxID=2495430 RepID=UPI0015801B15|nr:hypothetical protein [Curtobacterium sp. Csp2]QKS15592.1 hypothetical protein HUN59_04605 [Curtobacterium sp. Csp2]
MSDFLIEVLHDPVGRWFLYIGVVVGAVGAVGWGVLKVRKRLNVIAEDVGLVKHEVRNNHTTNLREEADDRHDENRNTLHEIRGDVRRILRTLGEHGYRISELEDEVANTITLDKRPKL